MKTIGLFEAKTKFSEICETVAAKGTAVVVTRRGRPLVRIEPIRHTKTRPKGTWDYRADYVRTHGPLTEEFTLPARERQTWRNPLED